MDDIQETNGEDFKTSESMIKLKYWVKSILPYNKRKIETLYSEVTNLCTGGCVFCSHHLMKRGISYMDFPLLTHLLHRAKPRKVILHLFGEPLGYAHIVDAVKVASYQNIKTAMDTNGKFLNGYMFTRLCEAGLDWLTISFGATTKDVYESIWTGCEFDEVSRNIKGAHLLKKAKGYDTKIMIRVIVTKENQHQLEDIKKMWRPYCDEMQIVDEFHLYGYDRTPLKRLDRSDCKQQKKLYRECVVKANGDVILCCCDLDGEYVVGNVNEEDIMSIWNGKRMQEYRDWVYNSDYNLLPKICKECVICPS